jgi:LacI family transcriptional regulator
VDCRKGHQAIEPIRHHFAERELRTVVVTDSEHREVGPEILADGSYDGVILTTTLRTSTLSRDLTEREIPYVLVNRVLEQPDSPSCSVDNVAGAREIAALLAELGHRRVALVQGPVNTSTGRERTQALCEALRARRVPVRRNAVLRTAFDHDAGRGAAGEQLDRAARPTAIVGGNDLIALGVLSAARERGLRVPEDLTVIGFDDIPMAGAGHWSA